MAIGWEPKWIRRKFKMGEGIEIESCVDITTGLIVCPMCVDVSKLCPSYSDPTPGVIAPNALLFFNADDMFFHMKVHARSGEFRLYEVGEEEEAEEEEGVTEEEESGES